MTDLPETINTLEELMDVMAAPSEAVTKAIGEMGGDFLILGAGGKMGPTLCAMLLRGGAKRVMAVDLYPNPEMRDYLREMGCETITCDLLDSDSLKDLPDCDNVFIMAGFKFGSTGNESSVWAMNTFLPGRVLERFPESRVLLMSSGNVYKFAPVDGAGATEADPVEPIGEYAQSRLGGERVAQYVADRQGTKLVNVRLFYSVEPRYGIIHDLAQNVSAGKEIDLSMGHVNQIWQGDAIRYLILFLTLADSPTKTINITGPEILSVRDLAVAMGKEMGNEPKFIGSEASTALLGNSEEAYGLFGKPAISADQIVKWMAHWVGHGGASLGKPTKYERRDGKF